MANRQNGEVSIEIDGKSYTMALTLDAMVAVEDLFSTAQKSVTFQEVTEGADRGSAKHLRGLLWASLVTHHPDLDVKDVSALVQKAGGLAVFTMKLMELAKSTIADPKDLEALGVAPSANPPRAQAATKTRGTGERSISTPDGSA